MGAQWERKGERIGSTGSLKGAQWERGEAEKERFRSLAGAGAANPRL